MVKLANRVIVTWKNVINLYFIYISLSCEYKQNLMFAMIFLYLIAHGK